MLYTHATTIRRVAETPAACNTMELFAGLIGAKAASNLLARYSIKQLLTATAEEIAQVRGIGAAKAAQIKAALELGKRLATAFDERRPVVHSPAGIADMVMLEMAALEHEELWVLLLNTRNEVIHIEKLYRGSVNTAQVRVGEIFKTPIRRTATSIVLVHNHPGGDPTPSPDDVSVTRTIVQAGKLLDISVLDHIIIGGSKFVSLKDRGLGFN